MSSTTFTSGTTIIPAAWLNDVNDFVYGGVLPPSLTIAVVNGGTGANNAADARINLGLEIGVDVQAYDAFLNTLSGLSNGIVVKTTGSAVSRTITGTANKITVTNGDGVSGNPTITVGSDVYQVGGADVAVADGGTGASDAATARTNLGVAIGSNVQAYSAQLTSAASVADGLVAHTAANTFTPRTISTTAGLGLSVTNGDGVAGNPTLALDIAGMTNVVPDTVDYIPIYDVSGTVNRYATVGAVTSAGASGVSSLTGTANQITASAATGAVTLSIPYNMYLGSSASGSSSLAFFEDTDNGTNKVTVTVPSSLSSDTTLTLPNVTDTVAVLGTAQSFTATQGFTEVNVDNINLNGNTISTTNVNGALNLTPNGTGAVNVGTADAMTVNGAAVNATFQINSDTYGIEEVHTHSATAGNGGLLYHARSRGTTASPTIVQSGDTLGTFAAVGYDGTDYAIGGRMDFVVDGTPGSNDMPTKITFGVSADGSQTPTTALTINPDTSITAASTINKATITAPTTTVGGNIQLLEGTNNGTNKLTIQAPASMADVTATFSANTGTVSLIDVAETISGAKTFSDTKLIMAGATSGTTTLKADAVAGTTTQTFQAVNGTVVCTGGTDLTVADGGTGVSTMTTAYAPVCAGTTATGALQVASTGLGTSGYVLTSNGSSALPSFQAAAGGGMVWLATASPSAAASVDFGTVFTSTYKSYIIEVINLMPATDAQNLWLRISDDSGVSYEAGVSDYAWVVFHEEMDTAPGAAATGDNADAQMVLSATDGVGIGNATGEGCNYTISVHDPAAARITDFHWEGTATDGAGLRHLQSGAGSQLVATAVTGFQLLFASGNIASGTVKVYGLQA